LVPQLSVLAGAQPAVVANIEGVKWAGLRCKVKVSGQFDGCKADLRDKAADPTTSLLCDRALDPSASQIWSKPVGKDGNVSLVVLNDKSEGSATTLVILDASGNVVSKALVTVGG
jgi:hypothetical protein